MSSTSAAAASLVVVRTIAELRAAVAEARRRGHSVGLVPTMGALHDGHLSLVRAARAATEFVVVSLFVNPTQFNDPRDLAAYPRDERGDASLVEGAGASVLFAPNGGEVYPPGFSTMVDVGDIAHPLEGEVRGAAHFRGVATVVAKLLNMVQPDAAFFGAKDAQQVLVVRRLARDLDLPVRIETCPTVREADGLAMSSRNQRLSPAARAQAVGLYEALHAMRESVQHGIRDVATALHVGHAALQARGIDRVDYLAVVDPDTLLPVPTLDATAMIAVAAYVGGVRLIDNMQVSP